jgi:hypothetical protein
MHNDKSKSQDKCNKDAGQKRPATSRLASRGLPRRSLTKRISEETRNPPQEAPSGKPQRVSITDSFGASPVSSASDYPAGRDPGRALQHSHATKGSDHQRVTLCLANPHVGKVKQSCLRPLSMAAFNLITYGRISPDHRGQLRDSPCPSVV